MLACEKFIFLHLHKSGGTYVNHLMTTCLPGVHKIGYHLPASEIPGDLRNRPVLGTVRNPLAYYVSWYHFQLGLGRAHRNALFEICSDGGRLGFERTVERLVSLERRPQTIDALVKVFPDHFLGCGLNLTKNCVAQIAGSGHGFYTFLYRRMYGAVPDATILRAEELRTSLSAYLTVRYPDEPRWRSFVAHAPDMNRSRHGDIGSYYSNDLKAMVIEFDRPVFELHSYVDV